MLVGYIFIAWICQALWRSKAPSVHFAFALSCQWPWSRRFFWSVCSWSRQFGGLAWTDDPGLAALPSRVTYKNVQAQKSNPINIGNGFRTKTSNIFKLKTVQKCPVAVHPASGTILLSGAWAQWAQCVISSEMNWSFDYVRMATPESLPRLPLSRIFFALLNVSRNIKRYIYKDDKGLHIKTNNFKPCKSLAITYQKTVETCWNHPPPPNFMHFQFQSPPPLGGSSQ